MFSVGLCQSFEVKGWIVGLAGFEIPCNFLLICLVQYRNNLKAFSGTKGSCSWRGKAI